MNGTCILIVIAFIVVLYYIIQNKQDKTETFMPVRGNIQQEIDEANDILNEYYSEENEITNDIIMRQDNNNQQDVKNSVDFQLIGRNNLLNVDNIDFDKFRKLYAHQIDCPCYGDKLIGFDNCENNLDVFRVSNEAIKQHDNKDCVTCNFLTETNATLTPEQMEQDAQAVVENKLINSNIENFSDYRKVSNQDSNVGVNAVDRINECRTGGTCDLNKFGTTIWQAYDNLMADGYSKYQTTTNPQLLSGVNNQILKNDYQRI
jgi:hypothetical protein